MANLTIVVDDALLKRARIKAVEQGTSVNEVCRKAIEGYAGAPDSSPAALLTQIRSIARAVKGSSAGEPLWPGRELLYDEALRERGLDSAPPGRKTR